MAGLLAIPHYLSYTMSKQFICFVFLLVASCMGAFAAKVELRVLGDSQQGYYVNIYYGSQLISDQGRNGELDLYFDNEDYSVREDLKAWKATSALQQDRKVILSGKVYLKKLEADLSVHVIYEIIGERLVGKQIELQQNNLSLLYYSVGTSITSEKSPSSFWSFDDNMNLGGVAHETYPAAGYMLDDTLAVGLLTDAGDKNLWTRNIRRRPSKQGEIGFRAIREICDANLVRVADEKQRKDKDYSVKLTFGEVSDFNDPIDRVTYQVPDLKNWKSYQGAQTEKNNDVFIIKGKSVKGDLSGARIPYGLTDGFYTIRFKHRSVNPITMKLWKGEGTESMDVAGLHYQTDMPSSVTEWVQQEETVFIANTENELTYLLIAASSLKKGTDFKLEVKDLEVTRLDAHNYAYHRLEQGKKAVKKVFIFAAPSQPTLHDLRLASQVYLADGLGFQGSTEEKCLYACYQMLMWITSRNNFAPLNVPSINYAPDMYNRDSFWSMMGVYDKEASEKIFDAWAATQDERGAIGTIITPCMGSREVKGNDATLEFLWYALVNHRLYGTTISMDKVKKAFEFCINEYDPDGDGICAAEFVLGQNDVVEYPNKTSDLAVNQGMLAITLQVARELGLPVSQDYIERANQGYRNFYDKKKGYLVDNRQFPYSITFNSLLPEFVSWWLFDKQILTSEMVINTLNKVPSKDGYSPLIFHEKDTFFTMENKPFSPNMFWENGIYYNGGSWMREEICGYVAGLKHGWKDAEKRIKDRLTTEITLHPDEPFSHEFLPFDLSVPGCWWPSTRVFSWNVFVLRALEVAGMRSPMQDPCYFKYVQSRN